MIVTCMYQLLQHLTELHTAQTGVCVAHDKINGGYFSIQHYSEGICNGDSVFTVRYELNFYVLF